MIPVRWNRLMTPGVTLRSPGVTLEEHSIIFWMTIAAAVVRARLRLNPLIKMLR